MHGDFGDGHALVFVIAAARESPAGDAAEEMKAIGGSIDAGFDFLRKCFGKTVAAFEDDQVFSRRAAAGADDVEGNGIDRGEAEAAEDERFVGGGEGIENSPGGIGGEGAGEIDDAEFGFVAHQVSDEVAQAIGTERFEAVGHERQAGGTAADDVVLLDFVIGSGVAENDGVAIFAGDDAVEGEVIPGFDGEAEEVGFHDAIGIENVDEEIVRAVSAHAGEVGSDIAAFAFELMAVGAVLRVKLAAFIEIAALLDRGSELLDEGVLLLELRAADFIDHIGGAFGDIGICMSAEAMDEGGAEMIEFDFFFLQRGDELLRPFRTLDDLCEDRIAGFEGDVGIDFDKFGADRFVGNVAHGFGDAALEAEAGVAGEESERPRA